MLVRRSLLCALVACLLAGACSSGSKHQAKPGVVEQHVATGDLELDNVAWDEVGPRQAMGPLDDGMRTKVLKTLQRTFDATVVRPISTGEAGPVDALFTADAAARATGQDRAVLFDEGLPDVGTLVATRANVRLIGLDGGNGPALVVAKIDWDVRSADGKVRVQRGGELSLIPVFDTWLVGAYTVITTRTVGGATTTTTAAG